MMLETDKPLIYLDNAATTFPKPEAVYRAMDSFYRNYGGNAGRGANPLARRSAALVAETRDRLKSWLNAPDVIFSPSATVALNTVILGARLRPGDVVYVTPFEHNSVLRPLEHLRKTVGIEIRILPHDRQTFECKLDEVRRLFKIEPPAMLCVTQVSNVFGAVSPVDDLTALVKQASSTAITLADGAQAAGLKLLNMARIDALVFSGHKSLYGPYGVAGIAFGNDWRPAPLVYGGTGTQSESLDMPTVGPAQFEAGSHNIYAVAGLHAALAWLDETGRDAINCQIEVLTAQMCEDIGKLSSVRVFVPKKHSGIVSCAVDGVSPQAVESILGTQNVAVRAGLHCSPWAHEWAGTTKLGGTVRFSISCFNKNDEVASIQHVLAGLT